MKKLILIAVMLLTTAALTAQTTYNYNVVVGQNVGSDLQKVTVTPIVLRYNVDGIDLSVEVKEHNIFSKYNVIRPTYEEVTHENGVRYATFKMINLETGKGATFIMTEEGVFAIFEGETVVTFYTFEQYEHFKKV